jgi:hypothetical protein
VTIRARLDELRRERSGGTVTQPRAADDFAVIRARVEELHRERAQESTDPKGRSPGWAKAVSSGRDRRRRASIRSAPAAFSCPGIREVRKRSARLSLSSPASIAMSARTPCPTKPRARPICSRSCGLPGRCERHEVGLRATLCRFEDIYPRRNRSPRNCSSLAGGGQSAVLACV